MRLGEGDGGEHRHAGGHEADGEAPGVAGAGRHLLLGAEHEDDAGHLAEKTWSWRERRGKNQIVRGKLLLKICE